MQKKARKGKKKPRLRHRMNSSNSTGLIRELWSPLVVNDIKSFTSNPSYPDNPSVYYDIDKFSTPREKGKKFGQRIRGFFTAPQNGPYMFAVSCSDECKLFLSPNDEEDKKSEIIDHPTDGARDMSSQYIDLKAGRSYFIEALSIQNEWVSPLRVGVRLPNGTVSVPISKEFLRPSRAGLTDEIFYNVSTATVKDFIHDTDFPDMPGKGRSISDFDVTDFDKDLTIGHHISGYFMAPETGKFKFFGACSEGCQLYLSKDEACNKRSLVLDYLSSPSNPKFDVSNSIEMEAGLHYFIDALQVVKGGRRNSIKMGVVMPSGKSSFPIRKDLLTQFKPSKHGVIREVWTNVKGEDVRDLTAMTTYPNIPSSVKVLQMFDAPYNERYNYGQRIRGEFVAPMTGDYRFVMSCDKQCELWMSNSPSEEHKKRILRQTHVTARHQFEKYPDEQVSSPIHLDIGQQYYIEALHKAGTGLDHFSVGVTLPNGENEWPIPQQYLRIKPKDEQETHLKDPPCTFRSDDATKSKQEPENPSDAIEDAEIKDNSNNDLDSPKVNKTNKHQPSKIVHGWDDLHQSFSSAEAGRFKGATANDDLEMDIGPETSHKIFHNLKDQQPAQTPSVDLDDEMSEPTQNEINKLHKSVSKLIKATKGMGSKLTAKVEEKAPLSGEGEKLKETKEATDEARLEKLLSKFNGHGKIKIIRLKSNGKLTDDEILNALKGYSQNHAHGGSVANISPLRPSVPNSFASEDSLVDSMDALGTISKGQDFESQLLTQIPAEEAHSILAELSKPKPPPKIENSDGIKVAGDSGGNLQVMEQNPFSNAIFGSHTSDGGLHIDSATQPNPAHQPMANQLTTQKAPIQTSLMTEGQPVTVVGNLAEISKANARATQLMQGGDTSNNLDIFHAVGRPVNEEHPTPPVAPDLKVSHHVPINHVSDYDILDLDLAGLKQLSKTGYSPQNDGWPTNSNGVAAGNFPLQITQELEATPLVGDTMASMLTGDDEGSPEFYKRGGRVSHRGRVYSRKGSRRIGRNKAKKSGIRNNSDNNVSKRTNIFSNMAERKERIELGPRHKDSWHSHGNNRASLPMIKKSWYPSENWATIANYLAKLEWPKDRWKAGDRSLINSARRRAMINKGKLGKSRVEGDNEEVLQSLISPTEAVDDHQKGNMVISELLKNIADEVGGNASPLDEYLNSVKGRASEHLRDIVSRRPIRHENLHRKLLSRTLNRDELKKIDDITVRDD